MVSYIAYSFASYGVHCLNPCCSGQWSRTCSSIKREDSRLRVLILVVVDNGLVPQHIEGFDPASVVLILVVVDNGLVRVAAESESKCVKRLNPCCSGQWSRTQVIAVYDSIHVSCLNPCCSGQWSRTVRCLL